MLLIRLCLITMTGALKKKIRFTVKDLSRCTQWRWIRLDAKFYKNLTATVGKYENAHHRGGISRRKTYYSIPQRELQAGGEGSCENNDPRGGGSSKKACSQAGKVMWGGRTTRGGNRGDCGSLVGCRVFLGEHVAQAKHGTTETTCWTTRTLKRK